MFLKEPLLIRPMTQSNFYSYFRANQNVDLEFIKYEIPTNDNDKKYTHVVKVESKQDISTPGISTQKPIRLEPNNTYEFIVRGSAIHGVKAFLWVKDKDTNIRIMDPVLKYLTPRFENISTVLTTGNRIIYAHFGILFTDPNYSDTFIIDQIIFQKRAGLLHGAWRIYEHRNTYRIDVYDSNPLRKNWVSVSTLVIPPIEEKKFEG